MPAKQPCYFCLTMPPTAVFSIIQPCCCLLQIANQVVAGNRLAVPPPDQLRSGTLLVYDDYVALMADCWQGDPAARPTFDNIVHRLQ